ncbi:MAG: ORF6N domain-containing protein [Burkholderiales bacterium]|nr:ORF6N domain-containing protein [Burkholderiales bacterium]
MDIVTINKSVESKIITIRNQKVLLDSDAMAFG